MNRVAVKAIRFFIGKFKENAFQGCKMGHILMNIDEFICYNKCIKHMIGKGGKSNECH